MHTIFYLYVLTKTSNTHKRTYADAQLIITADACPSIRPSAVPQPFPSITSLAGDAHPICQIEASVTIERAAVWVIVDSPRSRVGCVCDGRIAIETFHTAGFAFNLPSVAGGSQSRAAGSHGQQSVTGSSGQSRAAVSHGPQSVAGSRGPQSVAGSRGPPPVTGSSGQ